MFTPFGIAAGIVLLGILIFVHELGHFCIAKLAGVKVLKFSLGFGPRLISRKWGETEYMICAVPLGGYVQMLGEGGGENGETAELTEAEMARSFAHRPLRWRAAIVAAGPIMNLLLPFLVLPLVYLVGLQLPAYLDRPACIGYVVPGSEGAQAGFTANDCLRAINGDEVPNWEEANKILVGHAGTPLTLTIERGSSLQNMTMQPENGGLEGLQSLGLLPQQAAIIGSLAPGMPAAAAGMQLDDRIVAIDGAPVFSWYDLKRLIQAGGGVRQNFEIERNGTHLNVSLQAKKADGEEQVYLIGIAPKSDTVFKRFGPVEAFKAGVARTADLIELTLVFIKKLLTGHVSAKNIGGPITVVQVAGEAARTDLASILSVLAFLSIQLGILNLLPIPILDGGHLFFYATEAIIRRPLSLRAREIAQQVGLILLILLMVLAFYNDIVRIFFGG